LICELLALFEPGIGDAGNGLEFAGRIRPVFKIPEEGLSLSL